MSETASHEQVARTHRASGILPALALAVVIVVAYAGVGRCGFVNLDDDAYVEHQPLVNRGLRSATVAWAFTSGHSGIWHPLTTLSHALDCTLFGVRPAPMHWMNLALHVANTSLVLLLLRTLIGGTWGPLFAAAVFGLHPLNVESVAWISERKNVLSTLFWLLALLAYVHYARQPSVRRYLAVGFVFVLALMSKPSVVTFPFVLLLLDYWPLTRWRQRPWRELLWEKAPLLALTAATCVITLLAQADAGATNYGRRFGLAERTGNAVVSYARYLEKLLWPETLAPLYLHRGAWPWPTVAAAAVACLAITGVAYWLRSKRPWLLLGWLWFLGTLVPTIGLVQSGAQAMADRYMYVPMLGLLMMLAGEGVALFGLRRRARVSVATSGFALAALALLTVSQVRAWRSSVTLYESSIAHGEDNAAIRYLLAGGYAAAGKSEAEVVLQFRRALELQPDYTNAITQLAALAMRHGRFDDAGALIERTIRLEPNNAAMHTNLGTLAGHRGRPDEAILHYERALRLDPKAAGAHHELGKIYLNQQKWEEGRIHYEARAHLDRWNPDAQFEYGTLLVNLGRVEEGRSYLERALWLNPDHELARKNLAVVAQALAAQNK